MQIDVDGVTKIEFEMYPDTLENTISVTDTDEVKSVTTFVKNCETKYWGKQADLDKMNEEIKTGKKPERLYTIDCKEEMDAFVKKTVDSIKN